MWDEGEGVWGEGKVALYLRSPYSILTFIMYAPNKSKKVNRNGHQAEENAGVQRQSVCIVYVRTYLCTVYSCTYVYFCVFVHVSSCGHS